MVHLKGWSGILIADVTHTPVSVAVEGMISWQLIGWNFPLHQDVDRLPVPA